MEGLSIHFKQATQVKIGALRDNVMEKTQKVYIILV
jgi:hypothetical protein